MKKYLVLVLAAFMVIALGGTVWATSTATQTVTYEVTAINEISVSGDPGHLIIDSATAGSQPTGATDATTTYAITTNGTNMKITGAIDEAMGTGLTLKVNLAAPTGGTSSGDVTLAATAADLVTGITGLAESGKTITYTLSATLAASIASGSKTVTFTLTSGT